MSKLSFRARALDASKPMPIYLAEELPDLPDYSAINRAVPQMPSGMEKEEESEHHLQRAISGTGLIIPTPEVCDANDLEFYERCYPPDYKMPKQHIHMQPLWEEQEAPEYDIDSEDERWLKQQRHPELTELLFEQMMDKLEKCSGQTVVTLSEAKLLLERKDDLVIAVYDYWLNKRLNTQHPLILSVKTESRPGQSSNNPYLAFRRRTEKMQTRKNRKNDESSYEKMLKLRRDLARALGLLRLVAQREQAKRDLVRLTATLADRRYAARDFATHLAPDPPPRPQYTLTVGGGAGVAALTVRRDAQLQHFPPRLTPQPIDQRQREKRPYKRRRKHQVVGSVPGLRDSTSEEESGARTETASPPDDGPFSFRRKPGCFYEMPTATLCGDPVDPDNPNGLFEHELDERHRYTLTSISHPYPKCVGFARRRLARGGRVVLDRVKTPLDDLWPKLQFQHVTSSRYRRDREEEVEFETKAHRNPMELSRDYHTSGKHPWRRAFRQHLSRNPHLWLADVKTDADDVKMDVDVVDDIRMGVDDVKMGVDDVRMGVDDVKMGVDDVRMGVDDVKTEIDKSDLPQDSDISDVRTMDVSDDSVRCGLDSAVKENLGRVLRKRAYSGCSDDSSYDSDESLHPVEKEFEKFITEVNRKWLHFRPKTPPPSPPPPAEEGFVPLLPDTPFQVELQPLSPPSHGLDVFTTTPFTLSDLYPDVEADISGNSLDISGDDLLGENLGLTDAQVESILSETDLKALDVDLKDKKIAEDILEELVKDVDVKDSFLSQGQSSGGRSGSGARRRSALGSSAVTLRPAGPPPAPLCAAPPAPAPPPAPPRQVKPEPPEKVETPKAVKPERSERLERIERDTKPISPSRLPGQVKQGLAGHVKVGQTVKMGQVGVKSASQEVKVEVSVPSPVPTSKIIVEEVNEVPQQIKLEKKKSVEQPILEETPPSTPLPTVSRTPITVSVSLPTSGINLPPGIKKTTAVSSPARRSLQDHHHPQILTVAVSDHLKVRLQNHLVSSTASGSPQVVGVVQNGPFVALPVQQRDSTGVTGVSVASTSSPRRLNTPLVHLAPALTHKQLQIHPSQPTHTIPTHPPVVVAQSHTIHHVAPNKLKVLHAHPLTQTQRTQLLAQNRNLTQLPAVVSLATLGEAKTSNTALLKAASGSVTQFFEIKSGQLGKGPHLVNVVRQPQPGKTNVARIDLTDAKKRQVVATFDGTLKGNIQAVTRPHRVNVSLDGRQIVRAALPAVRAPHVRHQIQLKNRTFQMAQPVRATSEPSTSITVATPTKTASIPSSVVANLIQKNVIPKTGQKIAISGAAGQLAANVQAIAFTTAQLKARQARLIAQPRPTPVAEIVEASTAIPSSSASSLASEAPLEAGEGDEGATNGVRRRRPAEPLMEVT